MPSLTLEQWGIVAAIISGLSGLGLSLYQLRESRKDKQPNIEVKLFKGTRIQE
jgi:hypothetical protein